MQKCKQFINSVRAVCYVADQHW